MDQEQVFDQQKFFELLLNYQYSYIKPQPQLAQLLKQLPKNLYPEMMDIVDQFDSLKIKRIFRYLKQLDTPAFCKFMLKHNISFNSKIPKETIDINIPYTFSRPHLINAPDAQQILMKQLNEKFLIDSKNRNSNFRFKSQHYELLKEEGINQILQQCIKLILRSEQNMNTLLEVLTELQSTKFEIKEIALEIFKQLKEYIKNEQTRTCLKLTLQLTKDEQLQKQLIQQVSTMISTTFDEKLKYQFFSILIPIKTCSQELTSILYNIAPYMADEKSVFETWTFYKELNTEILNYQALKKLVTLNKHTNSLASLIVATVLENTYKVDEKPDDPFTKEFHDLIDAIFQSLSNNFKNFAKVVTQPVMFLSELKCILLYMANCEDDAPAKLFLSMTETINKNCSIFGSQSHLTTLKYLTSPSHEMESQLFLDTYFLHLGAIYDQADEFDYQQLMPIITLICFRGKNNNSVQYRTAFSYLYSFKANENQYTEDLFNNNFFKTLHNFLYQININQTDSTINFRKDRLTSLLLQLNLNIDIEEPYYFYKSITHALVSQKIAKKINKFQPFKFNAYHLLTKQGLLSNNTLTIQSSINYFNFLSKKIQIQELIQPYIPCLDPNNLQKVGSLDEFFEQIENVELFEFNETVLINSGLKLQTDEKPVSQAEQELLQQLEKLKSNKGLMMDEKEAQIELIRKQKEKVSEYYGIIMDLLIEILPNEQFTVNYFDQISQFAIEVKCRFNNWVFLARFFNKYPFTQKYKWSLTEFFQQRALNQVPSDDVMRKINQFQVEVVQAQIESQALLYMIHLMNKYIISQKSFDLSTKTKTFTIILTYQNNQFYKGLIPQYYLPFVQNINLCGHAKNAQDFLKVIFNKSDEHFHILFNDILSFVSEAQNLILKTVEQVPESFEIHLKLRILEQFEETKEAASQFIKGKKFEQIDNIKTWDISEFIRKSAKDHIESMINILFEQQQQDLDNYFTEQITNSAHNLFKALDDEQLEFYPYFIQKFNARLPQKSLAHVLDILIEYCSDEERKILVQECMNAGKQLLLDHKEQAKIFVPVLEQNMNKKNTSVTSIVFLGILSPHIQGQNQKQIQQQILSLFKSSNKSTVINLSRSLKDLLAFFPDTENLVFELFTANRVEKDLQVKIGHSYLIAGLIKGLGVSYIESLKIIEYFEKKEEKKKEPIEDKQTLLYQIEALIQIFGKLIEPFIVRIMKLLMRHFGDSKSEVRDLATDSARLLMESLSGYGVKIMLEPLLRGLDEDTSWRGKVANIWTLGNMAYCSPKQISQNLPQIVNSISKAISDTHPEVKAAANASLKQIGSTIKNPEISSIADLLIISLSNPYDENQKGIQVILDTKFRHYIDAPAMSLVIPIIDYGLKVQDSTQRRLASILVGGLPYLIQKPDDLVPYMDLITGGLEVVIGDALLEVRSVAAKAIGQISKKIGIENSKKYFKFIWDILSNKDQSSNKRSGAAHAFAEISCIHNDQFLEEQLASIYSQIGSKLTHVKEGYIGIFVYMPSILQRKFENYVKEVIENVYECVSHDEEIVSSMALRVLKILIKNFGVLSNELLYPALTEAMLNEDTKKRNAGIILTGEMLKIAVKFAQVQLEKPATTQFINLEMYFQNLMSLYILQQDVSDINRQTAVAIWKEFIDNTPKTFKRAIRQYIKQLCVIVSKKRTYQIACNSIANFTEKYGESQLGEGFQHLGLLLKEESDMDIVKGCYQVLNLIYQFTFTDLLLKYKSDFIDFSRTHLLTKDQLIKQELFNSISTMIVKVKHTEFVEDLIQPYLEQLADMNEEDSKYDSYLDIFNKLCQLNQPLVLHYLVGLILQPPLYQYKIDILTTNASTFAKVIYKKFNGKYPFHLLLNEIYASAEMDEKLEWKMRPQSLIYCIGSLSSNIEADFEDHLTQFIDDIITHIHQKGSPILSKEQNSSKLYQFCLIPLQILEYFLSNTAEEHQQYAQNIIEKVVPFIFLNSEFLNQKQHQLIYQTANKILFSLNNTLNKQSHLENMKYISTCFFNRPNQQIPGLNQEDGVSPYVSMLIDSIVFGKDEQFNYAISFIQILLENTEKQILQEVILKIIGSLIRILNYKINTECKIKALNIINLTMCKLDISQFKPQLMITYDKIVVEINKEYNGLKQLCNNYSTLFGLVDKKDYQLNQIFNKALSGETLESRECHLRVIKKILKDSIQKKSQQFSSAVLERFFILCRQQFDRCMNVSKFEVISSNEINQLAQILAITYKYSNKNNKDQYISKYVKLDQYYLLLFMQFIRYNEWNLDNNNFINQVISQINSSDDAGYVLRLLKQSKKITILNAIKDNLNIKQKENPQILQALSALK